MFRKFLCFCLIVQHIFVCTLSAFGPEPIGEDAQPSVITVKRRSLESPEGRLIVPSKISGIKAMVVDVRKKVFSVLREDDTPSEMEKAFQPSFPWHLSSEILMKFVQAHTFFLKQFQR